MSRVRSVRSRAPIAVAVLAAIILACLSAIGCGSGLTTRPQAGTELEGIPESAGPYLNGSGKELASGKTDGASVYSVAVTLDTAGHTIRGEERVLFTNRTPDTLSQVVFRVFANEAGTEESSKPATFKQVKVNGKGTTASLDGSILTVSAPGGIKPAARATVSFDFTEPVPPAGKDDTDGLYSYDGGTFNLCNFIPTIVTYTAGAWDSRPIPKDGDVDNFDCSYYSVSFKAPDGCVVAAPGVERAGDSGARLFSAGPVRDFEAQVSNKYLSTHRKVGSTTVTSYYFGEHSEAGAEALDDGCEALTQYSQHFGPYPYTRLNICEAPLEDDGVEYAGQVLVGSSLYEDPEDAALLESTVAHEVCHQWWALGVGNDSIGLPWLDESLTSYCEALYFLWVEGEASEKEALDDIADTYTSAREDGVPDAPVEQPVSAFADSDQYTAAVYGKGALFFGELFKLLGPDRFEKSLSEYYRKKVFLIAGTDDLLSAFRANSDDPARIDELYQRWITELHGDEDLSP